MIIVMKPGFTQEELNEVVEAIESRGAEVDKIEGVATSVLGLVGDTSYIDPDELLTFKTSTLFSDTVLKLIAEFWIELCDKLTS